MLLFICKSPSGGRNINVLTFHLGPVLIIKRYPDEKSFIAHLLKQEKDKSILLEKTVGVSRGKYVMY